MLPNLGSHDFGELRDGGMPASSLRMIPSHGAVQAASMKNYHGSAPLFRALVVSATEFNRRKELTASFDQQPRSLFPRKSLPYRDIVESRIRVFPPNIVRGEEISNRLDLYARGNRNCDEVRFAQLDCTTKCL